MMLEDKGYPEMHVIEVEPATMIAMCETHEYDYTIITPNDIVIPPDKKIMILFEKVRWKNFPLQVINIQKSIFKVLLQH